MGMFEDKLAWRGGALLVPDDTTLERMNRNRLSPSASKAIASCPARFVADCLIHQPKSAFDPTLLGSASHKVLELLFALPPAERTEKRAVQILRDQVFQDEWGPVVKELDEAERLMWITQVSTNVSGDFALEDPRAVENFSQEQRIRDIELNGVPFSGIVDRLDVKSRKDSGTVLTLVDYKTGKDKSKPNPRFSDDHGDQIRLYKAAVEEHYRQAGEKVRVAGGFLHYITARTKRQVPLSRKADIDKTLYDFAQDWDILRACVDSREFEAKPQPLCGWCPLVNSCPAARLAGRSHSPKARPAMSADELGIVELGGTIPVIDSTVREVPREGTMEETPEKDSGEERTTMKSLREGKMWDGPLFDDDTPNYASSVFITVGDFRDMALRALVAANPSLKPKQIKALADTFMSIVGNVQYEVAGNRELDRAINTRIRFHLKALLSVAPAPLGSGDEQWAEWSDLMEKRLKLLIKQDLETVMGGLEEGDTPWQGVLTHEAGYEATPWTPEDSGTTGDNA